MNQFNNREYYRQRLLTAACRLHLMLVAETEDPPPEDTMLQNIERAESWCALLEERHRASNRNTMLNRDPSNFRDLGKALETVAMEAASLRSVQNEQQTVINNLHGELSRLRSNNASSSQEDSLAKRIQDQQQIVINDLNHENNRLRFQLFGSANASNNRRMPFPQNIPNNTGTSNTLQNNTPNGAIASSSDGNNRSRPAPNPSVDIGIFFRLPGLSSKTHISQVPNDVASQVKTLFEQGCTQQIYESLKNPAILQKHISSGVCIRSTTWNLPKSPETSLKKGPRGCAKCTALGLPCAIIAKHDSQETWVILFLPLPIEEIQKGITWHNLAYWAKQFIQV
ncbi:unnamed protein product [Periconia digitata]|uniref:Uncharacterized protein n=1 Tax=Periconia digitata TaxID=1303443 RepID=A0A9W4UPL6_9PLEO|nr:unnamed protein product [Periconia digitata]